MVNGPSRFFSDYCEGSQIVLGISSEWRFTEELTEGLPDPMGYPGVQRLPAQMTCKSHNKSYFKGSLLSHNVTMV